MILPGLRPALAHSYYCSASAGLVEGAGSIFTGGLFFFLAFAGTGLPWASWAVGDFCAKLIMIALLLYPFRLVVRYYPQPLKITG